MLPDKETRCHKTGFQETCFKCVTEYGCRLWKRAEVFADRANGEVRTEVYDCMDSLQDLYWRNMLGRQDTTSATVDKLRKEVREANDSGMVNALMGINAQVRRVADSRDGNAIAEIAASPQRLIGSD